MEPGQQTVTRWPGDPIAKVTQTDPVQNLKFSEQNCIRPGPGDPVAKVTQSDPVTRFHLWLISAWGLTLTITPKMAIKNPQRFFKSQLRKMLFCEPTWGTTKEWERDAGTFYRFGTSELYSWRPTFYQKITISLTLQSVGFFGQRGSVAGGPMDRDTHGKIARAILA